MSNANNGKPPAGGLRASGKAGLEGRGHLIALTALFSDRVPAQASKKQATPKVGETETKLEQRPLLPENRQEQAQQHTEDLLQDVDL